MSSPDANSLSLVLGGGAGRGIAHVGAWRAVQELGINTRRVVGSSVGALIGACVAAGMSWQDLAAKARRIPRSSIFSLDPRLVFRGTRNPSLLREDPLRELIRVLLPVLRFDDLRIPLSINAVDLGSGAVVWFGEGGRTDLPLPDAVYASCALPLVFPPAMIAGHRFVDGSMLDPLPIPRARALGGGRILAVDLATREPGLPDRCGLLDTYRRVFEILRSEGGQSAPAEPHDDVVRIRPCVAGPGTFDLSRSDELIRAGYGASIAALTGRVPDSVPAGRLAGRASRRLPSWLAGLAAVVGHRVHGPLDAPRATRASGTERHLVT